MLTFNVSNQYQGYGLSQGLDRGLLVYHDDVLLVEEGMGIGACALKTEASTYFASIKEIKMVGDSFHVTYAIDKKRELMIMGIRLHLLTKMQEYFVTNFYMKHENKQNQMLKFGIFLRNFFHVKNCFVSVQTQGEVTISYTPCTKEIVVNLSCKIKQPGARLYVMNELGSGIFDQGIMGGELVPPPSGWQKMEKPWELYSDGRQLTFTMVEGQVPDNAKSKIYWGREHIINQCGWAGFENEITFTSDELRNYQYCILFREGVKL